MHEDMTSATQLRPKFNFTLGISPKTLLKEIGHLLDINESVEGKIVDNYIYLKIPEKDQNYWSPEMRVAINESEKGSNVKGVVGPNGKVWGTFLVFYGLAVMLFIFGGSLGISQIMLGQESSWIWSIPASIFLYMLIVVAAKYGQRLGHQQHLRLRYFLDEALAIAENDAQSSEQIS